jgi:hypothetical protein
MGGEIESPLSAIDRDLSSRVCSEGGDSAGGYVGTIFRGYGDSVYVLREYLTVTSPSSGGLL